MHGSPTTEPSHPGRSHCHPRPRGCGGDQEQVRCPDGVWDRRWVAAARAVVQWRQCGPLQRLVHMGGSPCLRRLGMAVPLAGWCGRVRYSTPSRHDARPYTRYTLLCIACVPPTTTHHCCCQHKRYGARPTNHRTPMYLSSHRHALGTCGHDVSLQVCVPRWVLGLRA